MYGEEPEDYHPRAAARTMFLDEVDAGDAETILAQLERSTASMAACQLRVLGGAMARVPEDATAFAHRKRRIMATVAAVYQQPGERETHEAWVAGLSSALPSGDNGAYVGFLGDEGPEGVRGAYPATTWNRLAAVKATYDHDNVFRLNHNIPPMP